MRYFISFLVALGLLILVIFLLFHGGGKKPSAPPLSNQTLGTYYTTNAQVVLTIDGPVNYDQEHTQVRITVGNDNVTYEQLQGYSGNVVRTQQYPNNPDAYAAFLMSLQHADFAKGNKDPKKADERGICPLGDRYIFELTQDNRDLQRYWATSCGGAKTYEGNVGLTIRLFQLQVPDYPALTKGLPSHF